MPLRRLGHPIIKDGDLDTLVRLGERRCVRPGGLEVASRYIPRVSIARRMKIGVRTPVGMALAAHFAIGSRLQIPANTLDVIDLAGHTIALRASGPLSRYTIR